MTKDTTTIVNTLELLTETWSQVFRGLRGLQLLICLAN